MTLSPLIRFGTSTWTYEGWKGQIYTRTYTKTGFTWDCLVEFCQYLYKGEPLFRTVGNDATFYRPPTASQLSRYLDQIPEDFEMCAKVWEEITIPTYATHARYGIKAGQRNPNFLNADALIKLVLQPYGTHDSACTQGRSYSNFNATDCPSTPAERLPVSGMPLKSGMRGCWTLNTRRCSGDMAWRISTITGPSCRPSPDNING